MTRAAPPVAGWLLFSGRIGDEYTITGDVYSAAFTVNYGTALSLRCELSRSAIRKERYRGESLWPALQSWVAPGRRLPPDILALQELVRRHQAEYEDIRQSEAVLRALGG